jgi:uncharacterized protein DUF5916/cellulose/xylan binding protein with CBM9 domain
VNPETQQAKASTLFNGSMQFPGYMRHSILIALLVTHAAVASAQQTVTTTTTNSAARSSPKAIVLPPEKAQPVRIPKIEKPPVIDGKLDDEIWKSAVVLKDFYQTQPGDNIAPSHPTEAFLAYDSKTLYIAFRATDEPARVRATVAKRDQVFDDDTVQVVLDTFNDKRKAYILAFNPLGIQADGILTEGQGDDYSVDIVMESKGVLTEQGYTVEVAIPFKSLRYEAGKDKLWGIHLTRRIRRLDNENNSWMPISRDKSSFLGQEGHITGLEGIATERTLEIIPTLTISESGRRVRTLPVTTSFNDPGRFINSPAVADAGVSVKFGITPTVTLDFTANPDFAQVEADQTVVTANQRFPIFFGEKRPFFLEGIDIFQTPIQAVHTRAIVDPDYAVKLTGKQGRNTFGLLMASDNAPGSFSQDERDDPENFPSIEKFIDKNAYIGVLRLKRDIGKESSIGFIGTSYNFIEKHNQLGGFDGRFRINKQTTFDFQVLGTSSRNFFYNPDRDEDVYRTGNALAYSWTLDKSGRNFGYFLNGRGRTRDYRADVGFTQRTNDNSQLAFFRYSTDPKPKATLISWRVSNVSNISFDWDGRSTGWFDETQASFNFARSSFFLVGLARGYERVFEEEFGPKRSATRAGTFFGDNSERSVNGTTVYMVGETNPRREYSLFTFIGRRFNTFDFDFGAGPRFPRVSPAALIDPDAPLDPGSARSFDVEIGFTYKPIAALKASLSYSRNKLTRNDTDRVVFISNIYSLNSTYQFTRFTFVRARMDYSTLGSSVRGQYLLGWTPNPGTSFYVGYNDDMSYNGFSPFTSHLEPGFRRNGRTFFIKTSYLFRRSL